MEENEHACGKCRCGHLDHDHSIAFEGEMINGMVTKDIKAVAMECMRCNCNKFVSEEKKNEPDQ